MFRDAVRYVTYVTFMLWKLYVLELLRCVQPRFVTLLHVTFMLCCFTLCSNIQFDDARLLVSSRFFAEQEEPPWNVESRIDSGLRIAKGATPHPNTAMPHPVYTQLRRYNFLKQIFLLYIYGCQQHKNSETAYLQQIL